MYKKILLALFLFLFVFPSGVRAATYYVAKDGDDSDPGTEAEPFLTANQGVSVLSAGDTLYIKAGTYAESLEDVIPSGTSWSNPVTVAAFPGDSPILLPNVSTNRVLYFSGGDDSYIIVDGFVLDGTNIDFDIIKITTGSHHIRIKNSEIKNSPAQGILVTQAGSDDNEFLNLTIHDNGASGLDHGLYIQTDNNLISGNTIYSQVGHGVHLFNGDPDNNTIRNNNIYDNTDRGIGVYIGSDNVIYNNITRGSRRGIMISDSTDNTEAYNNTVYANTQYGILVGNVANTTLHNNIVNHNLVGISVGVSASGVTLRNNLIVGNSTDYEDNSSVATSIDNIFTAEADNPRFINPSTNNFDLQAVSPAIDAGITVAVVTNDYSGTTRPQGSAYDIGAYEYTPPSTSIPTLVSAATSATTYSETFTYNGTSVSALPPAVKLTQTATGNASITGDQNEDKNILEFSGKAPANALINVRLTNDQGKIVPGIAKADADGVWKWKPPSKLDPGGYAATFTTQDEKGNTGSTTLKFTIGFDLLEKILEFVNNTILSLFTK